MLSQVDGGFSDPPAASGAAHINGCASFFSTDLSCTSPDEQCVITYVSMFLRHYSASREVSAPRAFGRNSSLSAWLQDAGLIESFIQGRLMLQAESNDTQNEMVRKLENC